MMGNSGCVTHDATRDENKGDDSIVVLNKFAEKPLGWRHMKLDEIMKTWFIHQVDRWPDRGGVGGYYLFYDGGHREILMADKTRGIVYLANGNAIELGSAQSEHGLFMVIMGNPWDRQYKAELADDEDRSDYVPKFIASVADLVAGRGELHNKYVKG